MRKAPSRRMDSPFSISFSTMCCASAAYSSGRPNRAGNGTLLPSAAWTSPGRLRQHRRVEDAGSDRADANAAARKLARNRKRHRDDAALGRGVRRLSDLSVPGRNRCGVDDDAAFPPALAARSPYRCGEPDHVEGTDQVDAHDSGERLEAVRPSLADDAFGRTDPSAVDQPVQGPEPTDCGLDRRLRVTLAGHIGLAEARPLSRAPQPASGLASASTSAITTRAPRE